MLSLRELEVVNFVLYEHQVFKFRKYFKKDKLLLVVGENKDAPDVFGSNGSGKSLIYEAFCFLLFCRTTRGGIKDGIIGKFGDACCVKGTIDNLVTGDVYKVERYRKDRKHNNNVLFYINDELQRFSIRTDVDKFIWNTLGVSYNKTINTCIFRSDDERKRFVYMGDPERKQLLSEMRGTDIFPLCEKIAGQRLKTINEEVEAEHSVLQHKLRTKRQLRHELKGLQESAETYAKEKDIKIIKSKRKKSKLKVDYLEELAKLKKGVRISEKKIKKIEDKIINTSDLDSVEKKLDKARVKSDKLNISAMKIMSSVGDIESRIKEAYGSDDVGVICDRCGSNVDPKTLSKHIKKLKGQLRKLKVEDEEANEKADKQEKAVNELDREFRYLSEVKEQNVRRLSNIEVIKERLLQLDSMVSKHKKDYNRNKASADEDIVELENAPCPFSSVMESNLEQIKELSADIVESTCRLSELKLDRKYILAWKEGYSREELQHEALQGIVGKLNEKMQVYSNELTNGIVNVNLLTEKTIGAKKIRNVMDLDVTDRFKTGALPFKEWSVGERKRIEIIFSFASIDIDQSVFVELFLDELFDGVDTIGTDKIVKMLERKGEAGRNIVVISHISSIQDYFDSRLKVTRKDGRSTAKYVTGRAI